jgi:hypothetical protein
VGLWCKYEIDILDYTIFPIIKYVVFPVYIIYIKPKRPRTYGRGADLTQADLSKAELGGADLREAELGEALLLGANLIEAFLKWANVWGANLSEANLSGANLEASTLLGTDLTGATLTGCRIYGISAWSLKLEGAKQQNLVITHAGEPTVTVDNIEVAQFVYLMLHNQKIRDVIDTITSKAVLILGRFTQERKPVLEALREELRQRKYLPILFDFQKPRSRNKIGFEWTVLFSAVRNSTVIAKLNWRPADFFCK